MTTKDIDRDLALVEASLGRVLAGEELDEDTLYSLADISSTEGRKALANASSDITRRLCSNVFDTCSIVNARSGRCPENCKWCAQSAHFDTGCGTYEIIDAATCRKVARYNADKGVHRFSLVTSGRKVQGKILDEILELAREAGSDRRVSVCASLGLLGREELQKLFDAGVHRYHCNLETAPSYFPELCTTHTTDDKIRTIEIAREIGFEICSGGIIGMGETPRQRMELAITLRKVRPASIPVNILCPIKGTPLADTPLISEEEIINTIALFRFAHPRVQIRLAGGRSRLSDESLQLALTTGINGAIVGDLLTTLGRTIDEDREAVERAGYKWSMEDKEK